MVLSWQHLGSIMLSRWKDSSRSFNLSFKHIRRFFYYEHKGYRCLSFDWDRFAFLANSFNWCRVSERSKPIEDVWLLTFNLAALIVVHDPLHFALRGFWGDFYRSYKEIITLVPQSCMMFQITHGWASWGMCYRRLRGLRRSTYYTEAKRMRHDVLSVSILAFVGSDATLNAFSIASSQCLYI